MNREMVEQIIKEMFFTGELSLCVDVSSDYANHVNVRVSILDGDNNELDYADSSVYIEKD